jgi:hypothetical protein
VPSGQPQVLATRHTLLTEHANPRIAVAQEIGGERPNNKWLVAEGVSH